MASFETLCGRKYKAPLCWSNLDEVLTLGLELVQETTDTLRKIQEHIQTGQTKQKSYADKRRRPLFQISDKAFLKVSPTKGIQRVRIRGKLNSRYIGLYKVSEKLNPVAYILDRPVELKHVHNVFHILQLQKHIPNPDNLYVIEPIGVIEDLVYETSSLYTRLQN